MGSWVQAPCRQEIHESGVKGDLLLQDVRVAFDGLRGYGGADIKVLFVGAGKGKFLHFGILLFRQGEKSRPGSIFVLRLYPCKAKASTGKNDQNFRITPTTAEARCGTVTRFITSVA